MLQFRMHFIRFLFFVPLFVFAHPHTFVDVHMDIVGSKDFVDTVKFSWYFDEMTSELLLMDIDQNLDSKIDKNENIYVKDNYFVDLREYNYYTNIKIDQKPIPTQPKNFTVSIVDTRVVYSFDIDIKQKTDKILIDFYDKERFVAMMVKREFIHSNVPYRIVEDDADYYYIYRLEFQPK
jgi:ABC-type uncharacterized transport system substrate-binding protein